MKRSTKRITSLVIVLCFLFTIVVPVSAIGNDISKHWASGVMQKWVSEGLIKGYSDGSYKPDKTVTRAEFLAIISRIFNYTDKSDKPAKDVPVKAWSADCISKALALGLITEDANGNIVPDQKITRQEAAIIIAKAFGLKPQNADSIKTFTDSDKFPAESRDAIAAMAEKGYIKGNPDKTFGYSKLVTRAEAITMLDNATGTLKKAAGTYTGTIAGNLVVNTKDVVLKDMTISGDLYLAQGIGDGNATLENVKVAGKTYVYGGGSNSVIVKDSVLPILILFKRGGNVRVVAQGTTDITETILNSGAKLEEDKDKFTGKGFGKLKIQQVFSSTHKILLIGDFSDVVLEVKGAFLQLLSGKVENFTVDKNAADAKLVIEKNALIANLTANAALSVNGLGAITNATINAADVVIEQKPANIKIAAGISATIGGSIMTGASTAPSTNNTPGSVNPPVPTPTPAPATTISGKISFDVEAAIVTSTSIQLKKDGANVGNAINPDAEGKYLFTDVSAGTYSLVVSLTGYKTVITPDFAVAGTPVIKDIKLLKQNIKGKIQVNDGFPEYTTAKIQLSNNGTLTGTAINADVSGDYSFTGIEKGQYEIHISMPGYLPTTTSAITVGDTVSDVGVTTLSAIYVNVSGKISYTVAPANVAAAAIQLKHGETPVGSVVNPVADGSYTIPKVAPGNYTIDVSLDGYRASTVTSLNIPGDDVTGKHITLAKKSAEGLLYLDTFSGSYYLDHNTAAPGDIRTLHAVYNLGERLDNGTVVFTLPEGFTATPGDMINIGSGSSIVATSEHISNNGKTVTITNITSEVGKAAEKVSLILKDKVIPAIGKYIFSAVADADGPSTLKCINNISWKEFEAKNGYVDDFKSIPKNGGVELTFSPSPDADSVVLEQSLDGKTYTKVSGVTKSSSIVTINGLTNGTLYWYRLTVNGGRHDTTNVKLLTSPTLVSADNSYAQIDKPLKVSSDGSYSSIITVTLLDPQGNRICNATESLGLYINDNNKCVKEVYINGSDENICGTNNNGIINYLLDNVKTDTNGNCTLKVVLKSAESSNLSLYLEVDDSCDNFIQFFFLSK